MLSWQVGAVKISCVVETLFCLPHDPQGFFLRDATPEALKASRWLYPHFANEDGSLNVSVQALLVQVIMGDSVRPIFDAGLADLVEMDHRISPEVRLRPTPGHTPGHVSVVIESEGQSAVITGDIAHHPCQMAHPEWATSLDNDIQAAMATRVKLFDEWADQPILVIGTHYAAPTAGHVKRDGAAFRFEV